MTYDCFEQPSTFVVVMTDGCNSGNPQPKRANCVLQSLRTLSTIVHRQVAAVMR